MIHTSRQSSNNHHHFLYQKIIVCCFLIISSIIQKVQFCVAKDEMCVWDSYAGAQFDLRPLMKQGDQKSYSITDGDDPCTRKREQEYDYKFNFCQDITGSLPAICSEDEDSTGGRGAAVQYNDEFCKVIGTYDSNRDESMWKLYSQQDPSKGVSITYFSDPKYNCHNGDKRTFTIDIICANKMEPVIDYLREPHHCQYHAEVQSVYGCPRECITTKEGLCNSHGHCAWDPTNEKPHCYCNVGYGGDDCTKKVSLESEGGDGYGFQVGLLVVLLFITFLLLGILGFMVKKVYDYRR